MSLLVRNVSRKVSLYMARARPEPNARREETKMPNKPKGDCTTAKLVVLSPPAGWVLLLPPADWVPLLPLTDCVLLLADSETVEGTEPSK